MTDYSCHFDRRAGRVGPQRRNLLELDFFSPEFSSFFSPFCQFSQVLRQQLARDRRFFYSKSVNVSMSKCLYGAFAYKARVKSLP